MRLLLDTCTFLWIAQEPERLSRVASTAYAEPSNECYLSSASVWEIAIKYSNGRLPLPQPPHIYIPTLRKIARIEPLGFDEESALQVAKLPDFHRDPFDRALIAQAVVHGLTILTCDPLISSYPARTLW